MLRDIDNATIYFIEFSYIIVNQNAQEMKIAIKMGFICTLNICLKNLKNYLHIKNATNMQFLFAFHFKFYCRMLNGKSFREEI